MNPRSDEIIIPKGPDNPYGSVTGPYATVGGWGKPANGEPCPKCGGKNFKYYGLFAEAAENRCDDCNYNEGFMY
jgi:hypothetical protein